MKNQDIKNRIDELERIAKSMLSDIEDRERYLKEDRIKLEAILNEITALETGLKTETI